MGSVPSVQGQYPAVTTATPTRPVAAKPLTGYRPYWAKRFGPAPFLPMSRAEMDALGWDSCDIIIVTGDAYVDHPSFGMAVIGRMLEAQGFRVGIIAQPDWQSAEPFKALGKPNLFFGVTAGNMDSMINRYTADRKIRSDDAYTPGDVGGKRPDRAALVYAQRCKEAFNDVPIVIGGIEASLRRIAHYDYWQDKVRRSILVDAKADLLLYGNAERAIVEIAHRLAKREPVEQHHRRARHRLHGAHATTAQGWFEIDSTEVDRPGRIDDHINPYLTTSEQAAASQGQTCAKEEGAGAAGAAVIADAGSAARPAQVQDAAARQDRDPPAGLRAGQERPGALRPRQPRAAPGDQPRQRARAGAAPRRTRDVWLNPPPIPLTTAEMDHVFDLPYARSPHPSYADETGGHDGPTKIPAWEMIRFWSTSCAAASAAAPSARSPSTKAASSRAAAKTRSSARSRTSATRSRASPASSATWAARPPTCTASAARARRSRPPAASRAASTPASART